MKINNSELEIILAALHSAAIWAYTSAEVYQFEGNYAKKHTEIQKTYLNLEKKLKNRKENNNDKI